MYHSNAAKLISCAAKKMRTNLWSANSYAYVYIVSIYNIIPINNCIYYGLILESTNSSLNIINMKKKNMNVNAIKIKVLVNVKIRIKNIKNLKRIKKDFLKRIIKK